MPMTVTQTPDINERLLAIVDPSMLTARELPTDAAGSFWHAADWCDVQDALRRGRIVVLAVEPEEVSGAIVATEYEHGGGLLTRYDAKRKRLWLAKAETRTRGNGHGNGAGTRTRKGKR